MTFSSLTNNININVAAAVVTAHIFDLLFSFLFLFLLAGKNKTTMALASSNSNSPPSSSSPGRPLKLPPRLWIAGVAFGLGWLTLLAVAPAALPTGTRDFALSVLSVAGAGTVEGARSVAAVAWGIHMLEGLYAAKLVRDAGGDAGAAAWWGSWAFFVGFPAVLMAKESVKEEGKRDD